MSRSSNSNQNQNQDQDSIPKFKMPGPRRISYTLPLPPINPPKWFSLPSLDIERPRRSNPLLIEADANIVGDRNHSHPHSKVQFHPSNPYSSLSNHSHSKNTPSHPTHTLAVTCLAVDSSTSIAGARYGSQPQGILYTGGRDGLVGSWELGIKMRKRRKRAHQQDFNWESGNQPEIRQVQSAKIDIDGSGSGEREEDDDEEEHFSLPLEARWEVDPEKIPREGPQSTFRQCVQSHTDWVNDIVLCNQNQTLISASSDQTIKLWNPHDQSSSLSPHSLGSHKDYVKCLSLAREAEVVASGGFDQLIKLWDIKELRDFPTVTIPSLASVYALSINPSGSIIAAGTPEKVVKVFDPRSGRIASNLIGHTDNIRSVIVSDDGRHLLSASSDSTVRLWSLGEQRCLHTFNHHSASVWSLASQDPNLDVFYSGDKDGYTCKVDWERCSEVSEGECVVLARDGEEEDQESSEFSHPNLSAIGKRNRGVHKIVALDNAFIWTANGSSSVNRWRDVRPRCEREVLYPIGSSRGSTHRDPLARNHQKDLFSPSVGVNPPLAQVASEHSRLSSGGTRAESPTSGTATPVAFRSSLVLQEESDEHSKAKLFGIPFDSLVCLSPPNDPYEAVGLGSASVLSVNLSPVSPIPASTWRNSSYGRPSLDQRVSSGTTTSPLSAISPSNSNHLRPSSLRSASIKFAPFGSENPREDWALGHEGQSNTDIGAITDGDDDAVSEDDLVYEARLAYEERESAEEARPLRRHPDETIKGSHGLIRSTMLNDRRHVLTIDTEGKVFLWDIIAGSCVGAFVRREIKETVEELSKGSSDGLAGNASRFTPGEVLELVKERIECEGSATTWCSIDTRSGSLTVHLERQRCFDAEIYWDEVSSIVQVDQEKEDQRVNVGKWVLRQLLDGFVKAEEDLRKGDQLAPGELAIEREISRSQMKESTQEPMEELTQDQLGSDSSSHLSQPLHTPGATIGLAAPAKNAAVTPSGSSPMTPTGTKGLGSLFGIAAKMNGEDEQSADYFTSKETAEEAPPSTPTTPSASNGLMGRFRFGLKSPKVDKALAVEKPADKVEAVHDSPYLASLRSIFQKPIAPPPKDEAPPIAFSPSISIFISESSPDASTWEVIYRGLIRTEALDVGALELCAPLWCLEYVLMNKVTGAKDMPKLSFVLNPFPSSSDKDESGQTFETMKELPSGNTRLTATRLLRMKKISAYICEKLGLASPRSRNNSIAGSRRSSADATGNALGMTPLAAEGDKSNPSSASASSSASPPNASSNSNEDGPLAASDASITSSTSSNTSAHKHYTSLLAQGIAEPHECVEILVNGKVLPPEATLAQCQRFWWKTLEDIKLEYRWKR